jgi:hypothetical protein
LKTLSWQKDFNFTLEVKNFLALEKNTLEAKNVPVFWKKYITSKKCPGFLEKLH